MYWHKKKDMCAGGLWRCREHRKALDAARFHAYYYERMTFEVRVRRDLATRRRKALKRRRERQTRSV